MMTNRRHRAHNPWKDYRDKGIYHITIVVNTALQQAYPMGSGIFGTLKGITAINGGTIGQELMELTPLGQAVSREWWSLSKEYQQRGQDIRIIAGIVMPDHFHGVIYAVEEMPQSIGHVIAAFKARCTQAYKKGTAINGGWVEQGEDSQAIQGSVVGQKLEEGRKPNLHNMSRAQRTAYYEAQRAIGNVAETPLFEDNYDDTILMRKGQLQAMIDYVNDNPKRAIIRMSYPYFYERRLHVWIDGIDEMGNPTKREYAAFGNLFLLRYPWKVQVMCHRWKMNGEMRDYNTPYVETEEYRSQHDEWMHAAEQGAVLVTPGISQGEQNIRNEAIAMGLPIILLQKETIGPKWKPEKERFKACENGNLLILAPWGIDKLADRELCLDGHTTNIVPADTSYSQFHNMNDLAAEICRGSGKASLRVE